VRRIPKTETLGYCHSRAENEITFGQHRPPLRLCLRDARYLLKHLAAALNNDHRSHATK
jgi:hypothetical protein